MARLRVTTLAKLLSIALKLKGLGKKPDDGMVMVKDGKLHATNGKTWVVGDLHSGHDLPPFQINAQQMLAVLKNTKTEPIEARVENGKLMMGGVGIVVEQGEDFPKLPRTKAYKTFLAHQDLEKLSEVSAASSNDEKKAVLNSILLSPAGETFPYPVAIASDGHRIHFHRIAYAGPRAILPLEFIRLMETCFLGRKAKIGGHVELGFSPEWCVWNGDGIRIISRKGEGNYPPVQKLIPEKPQIATTLRLPDDFLRQIEPGTILLDRRHMGVSLEVNGSVEAKVVNPGLGEWIGKVEGYEKNGKDALICLNWRYLKDAFNSSKEEGKGAILKVQLPEGKSRAESPVLFETPGGEVKALVMPIMA